MDFRLTDDQRLLAETAREFLRAEVTPARIRALWATGSGRDEVLWKQLAELGLIGLMVPEAHGGLGLDELDFVSIAEECGYVALPEPLLDTALIGAALLRDAGRDALAAQWLPRIAAGSARLAIGHPANPLVADAHVADLLLLAREDELHAVPRGAVALRANQSLDPSRRLFHVEWQGSDSMLVASGARAQSLLDDTLNRSLLGCAAQALGAAQRLVDLAVAYTRERRQFGQPIGSFQAVQHLLADVAVKIEYARAPLLRAAYDIAHGNARAAVSVSHAKLAACEAALLAARNAIQVHGAMGYTWEVDVHLFAKRAWVLDSAWGERGFHKQRIERFVLGADAPLGAAATFL